MPDHSLWVPPQFARARAQLHPDLRELVRDLERHGFCIMPAELIVMNRHLHAQLECFREALREVSNEKGQNLIIDDMTLDPDLLVALAPRGKDGTLPETYVEDSDGEGVMDSPTHRQNGDDAP